MPAESLLYQRHREPINLHQLRAKKQGKFAFAPLTAIKNPRIGVDFIPPLNAGLSNRKEKKISRTAMKFAGTPVPSYFCWCDPTSVSAQFGPSKQSLSNWVGDQGQCGCCWAYSTASVATDRWLIDTGQKKYFSPSWLGSCSYNTDVCAQQDSSTPANCACNGGIAYLAAQFIQDTGIVTVACDPFANTDAYNASGPIGGMDACPTTCSDPSLYKATENGSIVDPTQMQQELLAHGPIVGSFSVFENFMTPDPTVKDWSQNLIYVHDPSDTSVQGGHAVTIVGWGKDPQNGLIYWIVRNSWTNQWNTNNYVDAANGKLSLPGFFKIAVTGLNPGNPNSDVGMDSNSQMGGAVWLTMDTSGPIPLGSPCKTNSDCPSNTICSSNGICIVNTNSNSILSQGTSGHLLPTWAWLIILVFGILFVLLVLRFLGK